MTDPAPLPYKKPEPKPDPKPEPKIDLPDKPSLGQLFETLLKAPTSVLEHLTTRSTAVVPLLIIFIASTLLFGLLIGSFSGGQQYWLSPTKFFVGLSISAVICFPSLYIFTSLTGANLRLFQVARSLLAALSLMGILLVGFAPVVWVFTQSSDSVSFIGSIAITVWAIAFSFGTGLLMKMLKLGQSSTTNPITIWKCIFLLVTLQMSTSLRPIIGSSDDILTSEKRFFIQHWVETLENPNSASSSDYSRTDRSSTDNPFTE